MKNLLLLLVLLLSYTTYAQPPAYVPTNNLVGWWPFNANANDESGNGNNGLVNEAWPTTDRFGNAFSAYDFDGTSLVGISIGTSAILAQNTRSYSFWVNINSSLINENGRLITSFDPCACDYLSINGNHPTYIANGTTGRFYDGKSGALSTFAIDDDTWHHIVLIHDYSSQTASLYIDNVLNNTITSTNFSVQSPLSDFVIGNGFSPQTALYGLIDDIAIWNRRLTECEISALYHAQQLVAPTVDLGVDTLSICGASVLLDAGSDPSWASYLWSTSNTAQSITATSAGNYSVVVTDTNGCVGHDTTFIEAINLNTVASITADGCDTYTAPDGAVYTSTGIYTAIIPNAANCDSTITIDLTVNSSTASSISEIALDSYTAPSGAVYTTSGVYSDIITNAAGCDSVITITLTMNYTGIEELTDAPVILTPNPTSDLITIEGIENVAGIKGMELVSSAGRVIAELKIGTVKIDVSTLNNGTYFLFITHDMGTERLRFVKE